MAYGQIVEYTIVTDRNISGLESKVKSTIRGGFEPVGGITVVTNPMKGSNVEEYCQVLVRREYKTLSSYIKDILQFWNSDKNLNSENLPPVNISTVKKNIIEQEELNLNSPKLQIEPLIIEVAKYIMASKNATTSAIQRKFLIGHSQASAIIESLENLGIIGKFDGSNGREILISDEIELRNKFHSI